MVASFTWSIPENGLVCHASAEGQSNVVCDIHWRCDGVESGQTGSMYGSCAVSYTRGDAFTAYGSLELSQILGWIWAAGVNRSETEASVQAEINEKAAPASRRPDLPW